MLSREFIKKIAVKQQTTEFNVKREYFQNLFLSNLYRHPDSNKIMFKGGTALKIIHSSPRFSEDLDFSSSIKSISVIENILLETIVGIEREGLKIKIEEAKKTSGGYLANLSFSWDKESVEIQLEISLREKKIKGEVTTIFNDFVPAYILVQLEEKKIIKEKIKSLLTRQKPRDFYDVYFMLRSGLISPRERKILPKILNSLKNYPGSFDKELKQFLPKNHWPLIKNFGVSLERELKRFII